MPDASFWESAALGHDDLGELPRDRATLEAEVRRLRFELQRVNDTLAEGLASKDWRTLAAKCGVALDVARAALSWKGWRR